MQHGDVIPEVGLKTGNSLGSQGDFRDEDDGPPVLLQDHFLEEFDVDQGFPRSGHAVQEDRSRAFLPRHGSETGQD